MAKCPGQDMRFWKPDDIYDVACPACGEPVEFLKTDPARPCDKCGYKFRNPRLDMGCAEWCSQAQTCLQQWAEAATGADGEVERTIDRVIGALRQHFAGDRKRVVHALNVLEQARLLMGQEPADPQVTMAAAVLHDVGIREAERKYNSSAPRYQESEGPPIARAILDDLGFEPAVTEHICRIVGSHHSGKDIDTPEFRIVWDADWLVNLPDERPDLAGDALGEFIERVFRTEAGKAQARKLYLKAAAV